MIVVRGFGLDVDSLSGLVGFGFSVAPQDAIEPPTVETLERFDISQAWAIDYGGERRRPRAGEWKRWRRWVEMLRADSVVVTQRKTAAGFDLVFRRSGSTMEGRRMARAANSFARQMKVPNARTR